MAAKVNDDSSKMSRSSIQSLSQRGIVSKRSKFADEIEPSPLFLLAQQRGLTGIEDYGKTYQCPECGNAYKKLGNVARHAKKQHPLVSEKSITDRIDCKISCPHKATTHCEYRTTDKRQMQVHLHLRHKDKEEK
jgi:hypothetical protein